MPSRGVVLACYCWLHMVALTLCCSHSSYNHQHLCCLCSIIKLGCFRCPTVRAVALHLYVSVVCVCNLSLGVCVCVFCTRLFRPMILTVCY